MKNIIPLRNLRALARLEPRESKRNSVSEVKTRMDMMILNRLEGYFYHYGIFTPTSAYF